MSEQTVYRRSARLLEAEVDGELVALDAEQGACFGFNRSATRIWQLLEHPKSLAQLCTDLSGEFAVDGDRCREEVAALLRDLRQSGLVEAENSA